MRIFAHINYNKPFDYMSHEKLWATLRCMDIPEYLIIFMTIFTLIKEQLSEQNKKKQKRIVYFKMCKGG